ncbi:MAG: TIR domain-containing protein [bacterium]|nr:TIR domain-containing protein [bacterium]MDE0234550.1 TIR domain-containing protein [bacterium]
MNVEDNVDEHGYEYDIGLSFSGEQRGYVEKVAEELDYRGIRVFYDADEQADLWGRDLGVYFREVFQDKCRYCIVFASEEYANKMWPTVELKNGTGPRVAVN